MAAIPISGKRNRPSPPFPGTLTRSRSHHLLHHNRSGQTRPDPVRKQKEPYSDSEDEILIKDLCKKAKPNNVEISRRLAKDLRARRVYSPQSSDGVSPNLIESVMPESAVDSDEKRDDLGFGELGLGSPSSAAIGDICVDDVTIEAAGNLDLEVSLDAWNFDRGNTDSSEQSGKLQDHIQNDGDNGGHCSEKIDDLGEEPLLTTPPDAVICGDSKVGGDMGNMEEDLRVKCMPFAGNAEEKSGVGFSGKDDKRSGSVLRSKSVLRPRLPGKLFKAPGSVSYRRLFPFLLDIMGDDSDHCRKDEKGVDGKEFQLPLSSQSHEAAKHELTTDSCTNESNLITSMQLDVKEVAGDCLSKPSVDDNCASESNVHPTADFHGAKDVGNALHNDDFKQYSIHVNNVDCAKTTNIAGCTSEQFGVLNEDCTLKTPDPERYDNSVVNVDQLQSMPQDACYVKPMDSTISTQENAIDLKADKRSDPLKSKYMPKPHLRGKLFKTPGSFSFRRLLPFLMDLNEDDSGTSKIGGQTHNKKDEEYQSSNGFQVPLPSQSEEAYINGQMTVNGHVHDMVESALENNILVNPANGLSHCSQPKLTSSQDITELPMQMDAKEVVHECLSTPSVKQHFEEVVTGSKDECASDLQFDPSSTMVDFPCAKIAANAALTDGFNQILNKTSTQHYSESPTKDQNMLYINDVSNFASENHSSKEKRLTIDYDDGKQLVNLEKCESVIRCPPKGQSQSQLDPNMRDVEENETSSHVVCKNDAKVLNHVSVSSEEPRSPPSEKIISEKQDMAAHDADKAGSVLKAKVCSPRMPSKRSSNKNSSCAGEIENGSESKSALVLNRCPRIELLQHAGSVNYKRLLPFFSNEKPPKTHGCQSLSKSKVREQLKVAAVGFQKGILKRNPRGCRGLCTCLNCASFRLHAERAFEFSRNQLLDAEEVAQDLTKELSRLRNMLERYTDSDDNNPVFDGSQVQEACRKAFETEQHANHRLCEMNDNLNIHCRIPSLQRPRVKFSNHVEEKFFQPGR